MCPDPSQPIARYTGSCERDYRDGPTRRRSDKENRSAQARDEWRQEYEPLEKELEERKRSQRNLEDKLREREQQLDSKFDILDGKERDLLKTEKALEEREHAVEASERDVQELVLQQRKQLEGLAGMTQPEARQMLIGQRQNRALGNLQPAESAK